MDFTHGQSFRRKVDISDGFYRWNRNLWEIKISQFISRSVDFFTHLPLLPHLCPSQNVVFLPHSHPNPLPPPPPPPPPPLLPLSSPSSPSFNTLAPSPLSQVCVSLSHSGFVIYFCWTQEKV